MPAPILHTLRFRLGYADTDPAGILYYAAWLPWMERTQSEWLYLNDWRQDSLLERHGWWTVTRKVECEYLWPVGLYDEIDLHLSIGDIGTSSFRFEHRMVRVADAMEVARASNLIVTVGADTRPIPVPSALRNQLEAWRAGGAASSSPVATTHPEETP